jgi:hypothetical protein
MRPIERWPIGDWMKGQRTIGSDMQSITDAENLAIEAPVHLALNEMVQSKIHSDARGKQSDHDKHQRNR